MRAVPYSLSDLNGINGVNCYASARRHHKAVHFIGETLGHPSVNYRLYSPGEPETVLDQLSAKKDFDFEGFEDAMYAGCAEDGLKYLGTEFAQEPGYDTIAMFLKKDNGGRPKTKPDYHYVVYVGDQPAEGISAKSAECQWLSKVPFEPYEYYPNIREIEIETEYDFAGFFLAPLDVEPKCFSDAVLREVTFQNGGKTIKMDEITNPSEVLNPSGFGYVLDPDLSVAFRIGGADYSQMPPLQQYPNPVDASRSIMGLNEYLCAAEIFGTMGPNAARLYTAEAERNISEKYPNADALKRHLAVYGDLAEADWEACETTPVRLVHELKDREALNAPRYASRICTP